MQSLRFEDQSSAVKLAIYALSLLVVCAIFYALEREFRLGQAREANSRLARERDQLIKRVEELQRDFEHSNNSGVKVLASGSTDEFDGLELVDCPSNAIAPTKDMEPNVQIRERAGRQVRSFSFPKLHSPLGNVLAENVEFRDAIGLTVRFWNSGGTLTFGADQVHPVVLTSVGLKADLGLKAEAARFEAENRRLGVQTPGSGMSNESEYERRIKHQVRQQELEIQRLETSKRLEFLKTNREGSQFYVPSGL
jgi:hypothetical protein